METLPEDWVEKVRYPKKVYCEKCGVAFFDGEARVATNTGYVCWDCHLEK